MKARVEPSEIIGELPGSSSNLFVSGLLATPLLPAAVDGGVTTQQDLPLRASPPSGTVFINPRCLLRGDGEQRVVVVAGLFWLGVLFTLTLSDYLSRGWLG